jgi:hypothetical protein
MRRAAVKVESLKGPLTNERLRNVSTTIFRGLIDHKALRRAAILLCSRRS